ncbi:MAG: D-alanine--D-alanine ligase [Bacteroides sp.]|nr:D-alanine--D-alanine ligase [Bacteroides sp.]
MKKNIAIAAGGYTSEYGVSIKSAQGIHSFIDKTRYNVYIVEIRENSWQVLLDDNQRIDIDKNDFSFLLNNEKVKFDFVYITIHGTPGEDGLLQGYLEMINIPYSCCGVLTSAITYNKYVCNNYLRGYGIDVANSMLVRKGETVSNKEVMERIGLPCFIKPSLGGSSFGVSKVTKEEDIQKAIDNAIKESDEVIIEAFMDGTEVTCGCYKTRSKSEVFPITEVVTHNEFFDYDAKYNGQVDEITPARISDELTKKIQDMTSRVYDILNCKGIIRIDYIIEKDKISLLEVNTTPGMTTTSFIPQQIRAAKLDITEVMNDIIEQ